LRESVPYRFRRVFLPNFLGYDERTGRPCFDWSVMGTVREEVFAETVSRAAATPLRTAIWVSGEGAPEPVVAAEYVTEKSYSLGAFYQTIVAEGNRRCGT
jgi:hypothetical protein